MKNSFTYLLSGLKLVTIFILFISPYTLLAQIPNTISYQGILKDGSGAVINDVLDLTFRIYDVESGGSNLWEETHTSVNVNDGLFNLILGDVTGLFLPFDVQYWLGTIIDGGAEMSPRTKLTSVPYSLNSKSLMLPYSGINNTPDDAMRLTSTGNGGGLRINLSNSDNGQVAFKVTNNGTGTTGWVDLTNPLSTATALRVANNGLGTGLSINDGNTNNNKEALRINYQGTKRALFIQSTGTGHALWVKANGPGIAGVFEGNVDIDGDLEVYGNISKGSGSFIIDHPIDPENKYLYHSFVESPDMMNVYNGNIILNNNGEAIVELPDYFEALNKDFRYQLSCIGGYAPVYISEEISNNSFKIAGGTPGIKISWQVTGIRNDPFAKNNRIQVEVEKPVKERGYYLHYKEYNQPFENSIEALRNQDLTKK